MIKAIPFAMAAAATLALAACDHDGWKGRHHADAAKITADIKAQEAQWEKDFAARNVAAIAAHYADDAALATPGATLATDVAARQKGIQALVDDPNMSLTFAADRVEVAKSGDLAYSRGQYTLQMTDPATKKPATSTGTYITVWHKQADRSWKAVEDFLVPGPASAPATATTGA